MPFNGSGTYSLPAGNPVVTGTTVSSTVQNNTMSDVATAFTNCITRDGQSTALANLPMGGFKHTGAADATVAGQYVVYGQATAVSLPTLSVTTLTVTTINGTTINGTTGVFTGSVTGASFIPSGSSAPTNGIYLPAANTVGISTNSTARYQVDSSGHFIPQGATHTQDLGSTTKSYRNIYGQTFGDGSDTLVTSASVAARFATGASWTTAAILPGGSNGITVDSNGRLSGNALHNNANALTGTTNQYIGSGTYTPTGTAVANCSAITPTKAQWTRVGNVVSVKGEVTITVTATTLNTTFGLSLPIASNLAATNDLNGFAGGTGTLSGATLTDTIFRCTADTANDRANFNIPSTQASGSHTHSYAYSYEVL